MGVVGGALIPLLIEARIDAALQALFAGGRAVRTTVQHDEGGSFVLVGDRRVPLPIDAARAAGREVLVRYEHGIDRPRLTIQLLERPAATAPMQSDTPGRAVADFFPRPELERFASFIPRGLPISEGVARAMAELLAAPGHAAADRAVLVVLIARAVEKGALHPETAERLRVMLVGDGAAVTAERVAAAAQRARLPIEARLARILAATGSELLGDPVNGDLRSELLALKNDATFLQLVKAMGKSKEFDSAADRLIQRLTGEHILNTQQPGASYAFFEIPWADAQMTLPQVHIFEDQGGSEQNRRASWTVVIDVELSNLGALWIMLTMTGDTCRCSFRAPGEQAVEALRGASREISDAIANIGFSQVEVSAEVSREDRHDALFALSKRFSGVDVSG